MRAPRARARFENSKIAAAEIQKFKNERSWYNVNLSVDALKDILLNTDWYTLQIPSTELEFSDYNKVKLWHELAITLLKSFIERLYNYQKNKFFSFGRLKITF